MNQSDAMRFLGYAGLPGGARLIDEQAEREARALLDPEKSNQKRDEPPEGEPSCKQQRAD